MKTQLLEGSKQQIADQVRKLEGKVVRALVYVEEASDVQSTNGHSEPSDWERELDAMMELSGENTKPADVSREAMYSPENE